MSRFVLKRDETSTNAPAPEQLIVGELVLNSKTGRLYTKLISGDIIEYIGSKVCLTSIPVVKFYYENTETGDIVKDFCCASAMLVAEVSGLKVAPTNYRFDVVELTNNTQPQNIILEDAQFTNYTDSGKNYRKATIPISISVNPDSYKNISIFKFNIYVDDSKLSEHIVTIQCLEANN